MATSKKGRSRDAHVTSADEVRHFTGPVTDHTIAAILDIAPSAQELEVSVIFARGEGDSVDRLGHEPSGKAARIFDILTIDELYRNNER